MDESFIVVHSFHVRIRRAELRPTVRVLPTFHEPLTPISNWRGRAALLTAPAHKSVRAELPHTAPAVNMYTPQVKELVKRGTPDVGMTRFRRKSRGVGAGVL